MIVYCSGISTVARAFEMAAQLYATHIPTSALQKALLTVGSAAVAISNPARGDMVATLGETTGMVALPYIRRKMMEDESGRAILTEKPRVTNATLDFAKLKSLPSGTLGREYMNFLEKLNTTPDARPPVQFVDDVELAYVMQRYRETHDLYHTVLGMPTTILGEVVVKWYEGLQFGLPMCLAGGLFGSLRLFPKQRQKYIRNLLPWVVRNARNSSFLMSVYWEHYWQMPLPDLRDTMSVRRCMFSDESSSSNSDSDSDVEPQSSQRKKPAPIKLPPVKSHTSAKPTANSARGLEQGFILDSTGLGGSLILKEQAASTRKSFAELDPGPDPEVRLPIDLGISNIETQSKSVYREDVAKIMKNATLKPSIEKERSVEVVGVNEMKRRRKAELGMTKGADWFGMPATELTEERKRDLEVMKMRDTLFPKMQYKADNREVLPKYFQIGTVIEHPVDFYSSRIPKKQRKQTIVDEILSSELRLPQQEISGRSRSKRKK